MKALTLHQPWATCIAQHGKRVENRTWAPHAIIGQRIAIHAGKKFDPVAHTMLVHFHGVPLAEREDLPFGAVVATARVAGWVRFVRRGDILYNDFCGITSKQACDARRSTWWAGPIGWILEDVVEIKPVACKGAQGLWRLPADVERTVREHEEAARARMVAEFVEAYS